MYGIRVQNYISNRKDKLFVLIFEKYDEAQKVEKGIRFLDDLVNKKDYYNEVIRLKTSVGWEKKGIDDCKSLNIEYLNKFPYPVEYFEEDR